METIGLTDSQKVAMCIGFLKGIIHKDKFYTSISVKSVEEFLKEISK